MSIDVKQIKESFRAIRPHAMDILDRMYEELSTSYSDFLAKDKKKEKQQKSILNCFSHIIEFLEEEDHLTGYLKKTGEKLAEYNISESLLRESKEMFLTILAYYFDDQWNEELQQNWLQTLDMILEVVDKGRKAKVMQLSELKKNSPPSISEIAQKFSQDLLTKSLNEMMETADFQKIVRDKAADLLRKAIEQETKNMLSEFRTKNKAA